jgi:hypothetical protein
MIGWGARPVGVLLGGISLETLGRGADLRSPGDVAGNRRGGVDGEPADQAGPRPETLTEQP